MRIAFVTSFDARQPAGWSGTPYFMARALAEHCGEVAYVGPFGSAVEFLGRVRNRLSRRLLGRGYTFDHGLALAREYAWHVGRRLPADADLIVAPAGSTCIAFLATRIPILYTSDATFALMRDYYPHYSGLPARYARGADEIERRALAGARLVVYPSEWAAASARADYGVPADRIRVFPYGANLESVPPRDAVLAAERRDRLRLLFLGVDWERKGGPLAFRATEILRRSGWPAELTVVGCVPPSDCQAPWLRVIPRLSKSVAADRERLSGLLLESTFLLVPSRQECYGIVFCEASAHGTPSVAAATGGIAGAVRAGENGLLLPPEAGPEEYAHQIAAVFTDRDRYRQMVIDSRAAYETRLNWGAWARSVGEAVRSLGV